MGQCSVFVFLFLRFFKIFHVRLGKKRKLLVFTAVYVCVKAKLTLVRFFFFKFFFAPFPKPNMFMTMEMMTIDQDIKCPERMYWVHFDTNTEICQQSDTRLPKTRNVHLDEI